VKKTKKLQAKERTAVKEVKEAFRSVNIEKPTRLQKMICFVVSLQVGDGGIGPSDLDVVTWAREALAIAASSEPPKKMRCGGCRDFSIIPDLKKCERCL